MAIFGVRVEHEADVVLFFNKANKRMEAEDLIKNPFEGRAVQVERGFWVVDIKPIYPNVSWIGGFLFFGALLVTGLSWWTLPGFILGACGVLWTRFFLYMMMRAGLRKAGYKGRMRLIRLEETLRGVMHKWDSEM